MDKISNDKVYSLHPLPDGFLYSYLIEQIENQYKIGYKMVSFEMDKISNITQSIYLLTKFGSEYKKFLHKIKNYLTCFSIITENGYTFVVEKDGQATLFDTDGNEVQKNTILYKSTPPGGIAVNRNALWVSFPEHNVLIRYNLKTLREELRIGGDNSPLKGPTGLFPAGSKLFICCTESRSIWKLDCATYQTELYYQFDEPIFDYKFINKYEISVLDSGIYLL